jgi:hypothetical protein
MSLQADDSVAYETDVTFRNFPWGTSMEDVIRGMGRPVSQDEINGLSSLVWTGVGVGNYTTYMIAYFSKSGLQAGTYYFLTNDLNHLMRCYSEMRQELLTRFGPTVLYDEIVREPRPYQSSWNLPGGYVYLNVNTRQGEPVTLWYSSPELTRQLFGDIGPVTAQK